MPHCQKESHNRAGKSKKDKAKGRQEAAARRKKLLDETAEAEAALLHKSGINNIAPLEGHGAYEIGCEEEPECPIKYNVKKRSKKHLRNDLRKKMLRDMQEEEERLKKLQEEEYRQQQQQQQLALKTAAEDKDDEEEEEEEEIPILEYFVFICECCERRYATKNQFFNHAKSKKHRRTVRIFESLGLLATHVELRGENGNEKELYDDYCDGDDDDIDDDGEEEVDYGEGEGASSNNDDGTNNNSTVATTTTTTICKIARRGGGTEDDSGNENDDEGDESGSESEMESEDDDEYLLQTQKPRHVFAAFSSGYSSSSSSSSDEEDSDDNGSNNNGNRKPLAIPLIRRRKDSTKNGKKKADTEDEDNIDFDELIYQNQLIYQSEIDADAGDLTGAANSINAIAKLHPPSTATPPVAVPFQETYDPKDYGVNENRLVSVQHRLRKNLAAKGIEPSARENGGNGSLYDPLIAITMGKTLLQEVMEANLDTMAQKLAAYNRHKENCHLICQQHALAKGNSKAIPSQYVFRQDAADNSRRRANVHHAGSHYHMQAARTMQFGRQKGLMARHSSQGARLQASRMAAKEVGRMQQGGGDMRVGKTSKKSNMKRRGEAGGSKKAGGGGKSGANE